MKKKFMGLERIDWKNGVVPKVKERLQERRIRGIPKASIRGIFYTLVSLEAIPNTQNAYKTLSRALVKAREDGVILDDWIVDETRSIVDIDDIYQTPTEIIGNILRYLTQRMPDEYQHKIPRWYKQPKYVEVWVEKNAMRGVFRAIIIEENRQVRIAPSGGWSSRSFSVENRDRLRHKLHEGKEVYVLYYGDYDPTGLRMVLNLRRDLSDIGVLFIHVAITKEQITEFHLEHLTNPDPAVMEKLQRDPNANSFRELNEGRLFQIEVDALDALSPENLRDLLLSNIERYFDMKINSKVRSDSNNQPETIRRQVHNAIATYYRKNIAKKQKKS